MRLEDELPAQQILGGDGVPLPRLKQFHVSIFQGSEAREPLDELGHEGTIRPELLPCRGYLLRRNIAVILCHDLNPDQVSISI